MNKKGKLIGIIIILLGLGLLVGGFLLNNTDLFSNNGNKVKKKKDTSYSNKIENLVSSVTNSNDLHCGFYKLFTDKKMTINDLTNEDIIKMVSYNLYSADRKGIDVWDGTTYSKENFETVASKLFGTSITHQTISGCPSLEYDSSKGEYKVVKNGCENTCKGVPNTRSKIISSDEKDDVLVFSVKVIFAKDGKYYSDYNMTKKLSLEVDESGNLENYSDIEKGSLYHVVFKVEDDNYKFDYVEPVKD